MAVYCPRGAHVLGCVAGCGQAVRRPIRAVQIQPLSFMFRQRTGGEVAPQRETRVSEVRRMEIQHLSYRPKRPQPAWRLPSAMGAAVELRASVCGASSPKKTVYHTAFNDVALSIECDASALSGLMMRQDSPRVRAGGVARKPTVGAPAPESRTRSMQVWRWSLPASGALPATASAVPVSAPSP